MLKYWCYDMKHYTIIYILEGRLNQFLVIIMGGGQEGNEKNILQDYLEVFLVQSLPTLSLKRLTEKLLCLPFIPGGSIMPERHIDYK